MLLYVFVVSEYIFCILCIHLSNKRELVFVVSEYICYGTSVAVSI